MSFHRMCAAGLVILGAAALATACGAAAKRTTFDDDGGTTDSDGGIIGDNDSGGGFDLDSATSGCPDNSPTKIVGKVYDPAGRNPLYNIQVYVPSGDIPEIKSGLPAPKADGTCQGSTCDSQVLSPLAAALTNTKGEFELKGPKLFPGKDVPLVMQIGKWRRKIVIPEVKACATTTLDKAVTRLPKNGTEGDMPQIALSTGGCDALECLLSGIGIDPNEFEAGYSGPSKHIHIFQGSGGGATVNGKNSPPATELWTSVSQMGKFDIAMLSCECSENPSNKPSNLSTMRDFANAGGRVFATHYHYTWMKNNSAWGTGIIDFSGSGSSPTSYPINTSFPKGQALADWLVEVGASTTAGQITLGSGIVTNSSRGVQSASSPAQEWIGSRDTAKYFSFNTPVGVPVADQCGRFVFSDVHSAGDGGDSFPTSACSSLNAAQTALEYMFFDLSSCVQDPTKPPDIPR